MSDTTDHQEQSEPQLGYRQSRRTSKSAKMARRAEQLSAATDTVTRPLAAFGRSVGYALFALVAAAIVLFLIASAVNGIARWNALRKAGGDVAKAQREQQAKENLLVIGVENKRAVGFLALRVDGNGKQVFGMAIPDGAFIEVPGQGFERVGDSYVTGASTSAAAVSNFLGVPFRSYIVVPGQVYSDAVKTQSLKAVASSIRSTNLSTLDKRLVVARLSAVQRKNVAIVPLPVKPIKLGDQTYFEPQRTEVADLLKQWWGVDVSDAEKTTRVIVYNGSGTPGIAGEAAQQLIRAGFRVVDTKNADRFDYATTQVIVQRGPKKRGSDVAAELGVGQVHTDPADQDVADIIVIVGKDYVPPQSGGQGGNNQ